MDYSEAHQFLQQAIRKSPQGDHAVGFLQSVHKYFVIVQLLMGEIPERSVFRVASLQKSLAPYYSIAKGSLLSRLFEKLSELVI